jgi:hypothetical protein
LATTLNLVSSPLRNFLPDLREATVPPNLRHSTADALKAPALTNPALIHNKDNPAAPPEWEEVKIAAMSLGLQAELFNVRTEDDLGRAFGLAGLPHVDALVMAQTAACHGADGLIQANQQTIVDLATPLQPACNVAVARVGRSGRRAIFL